MGKYLMLWEVDPTKVPIDRKERGSGWSALIEMTKQDIEKGIVKEWGAFVGEINGFSVVEGTEVEIGNLAQKYVPFISFKVYPAASISQVDEIIKSLSE